MNNNLLDLRFWLLQNLASTSHLSEIYKTFAGVSFLLYAFLSIKTLFLNSKKSRSRIQERINSNIVFLISTSVFIISCRWPALLSSQLNPDESFFITGAMKLIKNPFFWRSVDGLTAGPLDFYPLAIFPFLGLQIEYASARIIGLILIITAVLMVYLTLNTLYQGSSIVRLSIMPLVLSVAFMKSPDYVHYTSEHVAIALMSVAQFLIFQYYSRGNIQKNSLLTIFFTGLLLGMVPYAKLQAIPIMAVMILIFIHIMWQKKNHQNAFLNNVKAFSLGILSFSLLIFVYLVSFELLEHFFRRYILTNLIYSVSLAEEVQY
jgi:hypothetical protein